MYELAERSLIRINGSTLITLPITWVRNNRLAGGTTKVRVLLDDIGRLVIIPATEEYPATGAVPSSSTPTAGAQHTSGGGVASV